MKTIGTLFSPSIIVIAVLTLVACNRIEIVTLEMETYYHVYDKALGEIYSQATGEQSLIRRAFIRVPSSLTDELNFGDSVLVSFHEDEDHFVPVKVTLMTSMNATGVGHTLVGQFEGREETASSGLVGFKFQVTESELAVTGYVEGLKKVVLVHFTQDGGVLKYHHLEVIREVNGNPIVRK